MSEVMKATELTRGTVVGNSLIMSDESYPFHPEGRCGVSVSKDGNGMEIENEGEVVNPFRPGQVNDLSNKRYTVDERTVNTVMLQLLKQIGFSDERAEDSQRGHIMLAEDRYKSGRRPFLIISTGLPGGGEIGLPMTTKEKVNTFKLTDKNKFSVEEAFERDNNFVNGWNPTYIADDEMGRKLMILTDSFTRKMSAFAAKAVGFSG